MGLKTTGISETAVQKMNRLQGVDTAIVDQASSGVVDTPPVSSGNTGLLSEARQFVAGSAIEAGGPRPVTQEFNAFSQANSSQRVREFEEQSLPDDQIFEEDFTAGQVESLKTNMGGTSVDTNYDFRTQDVSKTYLNQPNGGIMKRANMFSTAVDKGNFGLNLSNKGSLSELSGPDLAVGIASQLDDKKATVLQAMSKANAVTQSTETNAQGVNIAVPNKTYAQVMSAATEHVLMNSFNGTDSEVNPYAEFMTDNKSMLPKNKNVKDIKLKEVSAATNNAQLGQLIHLSYLRLLRDNLKMELGDRANTDPEYTRLNLDSPTKLSVKEAEVLGAAAKDIWTDNNRNLVDRVNESTGVGPKTQTKYILTPEGENVLSEGQYARAALFPSLKVKPLRAPGGFAETDMGKNVLRKVAGADPGQKFGNETQEAIAHLESIGNRVNMRRAKIMLSTLLPVLAAKNDMPLDWAADMYNIGNKKRDMFIASSNLETIMIEDGRIDSLRDEDRYNPQGEMDGLKNKLAQELKALAEVREGAFYLTYAMQGFQGRLTPQQTYINPTTSKIVRYVTTAVLPAFVKRGNRQDLNLRQMYAKALIEGGDSALPNQKEVLLQQQEGILYARGNRLRQALQMTDAEYEAVSQAMINKIPLDSPDFPKFGGLNLDPVADEDLIAIIRDKGEDGAAFIDASMDFANYIDHFKSNTTKPFESYLNAYMDGKTNGPATQGMQMGDTDLAYQTGVLRKNTTTLLDNGDIRNELMTISTNMLEGNPFSIPLENSDLLKAMKVVANKLYNNKDLAKIVIMTYGYGKELGGSFDSTFEELIELMRQVDTRESLELRGDKTDQTAFLNALDVIESGNLKKDTRKLIVDQYEEAVKMLMSDLGIESRSLMRAVSGETAIMDVPFILQLPNSMQAFVGKSVSDGYEDYSPYTMQRGQEYDIGIQNKLEELKRTGGTQEQIQDLERRVAREEGRTIQSRSTNKVYAYKNRATAAAPRTRGTGKNLQSIPGDWSYGGAPVVPIQAVDASVVTKTLTGKSYQSLRKSSNGYPYVHTIYDAFKVDANGYDVVLREVNTNWMKINNDWNYLEEALKALDKAETEFKEMTKGMKESDTLSPSQSAFMNWMLTSTTAVDNGRMKLSNSELNNLKKAEGSVEKQVLSNFRNRMIKFNPELESNIDGNYYPIVDLENKMKARMKEVGYDVLNPTSQPTLRQLKMFRSVVRDALDTKARLKRAINTTNYNKEQLRKVMRKESGLMYTDPQGFTFPLQYFTH